MIFRFFVPAPLFLAGLRQERENLFYTFCIVEIVDNSVENVNNFTQTSPIGGENPVFDKMFKTFSKIFSYTQSFTGFGFYTNRNRFLTKISDIFGQF